MALGHDSPLDVEPIQAPSVMSLAYDRIRTLIVTGSIAPGTRLGQEDLAERLGVSRTPVREALRRLDAEGLVDFQDNRGFRVAELAFDDVVLRLEVRLLLEPGTARLAAERATGEDLTALAANLSREERARSAVAVHDASREFHLLVAAATQNRELVGALEGLWLPEVGRRLLARRRAAPDWQASDLEEHRAIAAALGDRDAAGAAALMEAHVRDALCHWQPRRDERREAS